MTRRMRSGMLLALHAAALVAIALLMVAVREFLHWLPAKALGLNPGVKLKPVWAPSVSYLDSERHARMLLCASLPSLVLVLVGILMPGGRLPPYCAKPLRWSNVPNLRPLATDGQAILLSLAHIRGFDPDAYRNGNGEHASMRG